MADNKDNDQLLNRWISGEISDEELSQEVGKENMLKYQHILSEVDEWVPAVDQRVFDPREILNQPKKGKLVQMFGWMHMSVAASIVLILAVSFLYLSKRDRTHFTSFGEHQLIELPDGSSVTLASHSELHWDENDWREGKRMLRMKGKAFFDVKKGSAFVVQAEAGKVEVLGTKFDVSSYPEGMQVRCFEGKVRATEKSGKSTIVSAGFGAVLNTDGWEPLAELAEAEPSWLADAPKYENAPLTLVIKEMEAMYGIKIVSKGADLKRRFTGAVPSDDLQLALKVVFGTLEINYTIEEQRVVLTK